MRKWLIILIAISLLSLSSCSYINVNSDVFNQEQVIGSEYKLPDGYTLDKIEKAVVEWYNYSAWYYPSDHSEYYDQRVEHTITIYTRKELVFIAENRWDKNFVTYCDLDEDGDIKLRGAYQLEDNSVLAKSDEIDNITITMPYPYKPEFKSFEGKDEILKALEKGIRLYCEDYLKDHPDLSLEVYVTDFDRDYITNATAIVIVDYSGIIVSGIGYEKVDEQYIAGFRGTQPQEMQIQEFDNKRLERIKESSILHFDVGD